MLLLLAALLLYRCRLAGRPLKPIPFGGGLVRLPSDTLQTTSGLSLGNGHQGMNGNFVIPTVTVSRPTPHAKSHSRSRSESVAHPADPHSSASLPQPSLATTEIRKPIIPVHNPPASISHAAGVSASNNDLPSRQRINPSPLAYVTVLPTAS